MNVPPELKYTRTDEWVRLVDGTATIGITDYAQHELGELVYVELPDAGRTLAQEETFGVVESVKAVAELQMPLPGQVTQSNEAVAGDPSLINSSPYDEGWLIRVSVKDSSFLDKLLTAAQYQSYCATRSH
jgi:glycine cleavage system H protein